MGANPTQALGVALFLLSVVLFAAGLAAGGNVVLIIAAVASLAASCGAFLKAKPWEHQEQ